MRSLLENAQKLHQFGISAKRGSCHFDFWSQLPKPSTNVHQWFGRHKETASTKSDDISSNTSFVFVRKRSFEFDQKQAQRKASQMIRGCWALHSPRSSTQSAQCAMCSMCITVCIRGRSKKRCSMLLCGNSCPNLLLIWWGFFSLFLCSGYFLFGRLEVKVSNVWNVNSESESIEICHFEDELERSCATNVQIGERMKKK